MRDSGSTRALGSRVWGRKVAHLPADGVLLVCTDLQGNWRDYERMKALYAQEAAAGNRPILAFCGDLVHGPSPDLNGPGRWPSHLGTEYVDQSAALLQDFERYTREARAFSILGNHEHAHIGGPPVPKFYPDEAAVLDATLGAEAPRMHGFIREFPLLAVAPNGLVLVHGAPAGHEPDLAAYERLSYEGFRRVELFRMFAEGTLGALLWSRGASEEQAAALLRSVGLRGGAVIHGHDVVDEGVEVVDRHTLCLSTSFGLYDRRKTYARIDLSRPIRSTADLRFGVELLPLYPQAASAAA
ncbi:MAG: metallophosphoesterase [Myxococcales bacterium]|nr:metallophosphoesterase [Myxococcales bacterium]MCB9525971.1 metallophosphoesterase [Myxococcales bacterium]